MDPSKALPAASGGDTIKLCDTQLEPADPSTFSYTPSPGRQVSSVTWNHTDSALMLDPEPSLPQSTVSGSHNIGRSVSLEASFTTEETPNRGLQWPGKLTRLHAPRSSYNFKDDMEVFSPLVDSKLITPSLTKLWDDRDGANIDSIDKKPMSQLFPHSKRSSFSEDSAIGHPIFDWKTSSANIQNDTKSSFMMLNSTPSPSKTEEESITPPEAWGGERSSTKFSHLHQPLNLQDLSSLTSQINAASLTKDVPSSTETLLGFTEHVPFSSLSPSLGTKGITGPTSLTMPRRFSTYAERISATSSFSDGTSLSVASPKTKKTSAEAREELLSSLLSRSGTSSTTVEPGTLPAMNGARVQLQNLPQADSQQGTSFTLQLFQRTLEGTLDSFQKSIHEDVRNLHIEMLRQFHMQEMGMSSVVNSILENQAELMKEVESLRKENEQIRQLL